MRRIPTRPYWRGFTWSWDSKAQTEPIKWKFLSGKELLKQASTLKIWRSVRKKQKIKLS